MDAPDIIKILTEIGILIGVIGGVVVNIIVAVRTRVMHAMINGNATIQQNKIEELHRELEIMRSVISSQRQTAVDLARENKIENPRTSTEI